MDALQTKIDEMVASAVDKALASKANPQPAPAEIPNPNVERFKSIMLGKSESPEQPIKRDRPAAQKGLVVARACRAMALAKGDPERALHVIERVYGDAELAATIKSAMSQNVPTAGGYLVPEEFSSELIELLRPKAVAMRLGAREIPMATNTLHISRLDAASSATYLGEDTPITGSKPSFGRLSLTEKKLAALVPITNDLLRTSDPRADALVRDDLVKVMRLRMDKAVFTGAGTAYEPLGLDNAGVQVLTLNIIPTADTPSDFKKLLLKANVDVDSEKIGWAFNADVYEIFYNMKYQTGQYIYRDQMDKGLLLGYPYAIANQITTGSDGHGTTNIYFGDWNEFLIGMGTDLSIDVSTEAAYTDNGNLVSAFEKDTTLIRAISRHDFGVRQVNAFVTSATVYTK